MKVTKNGNIWRSFEDKSETDLNRGTNLKPTPLLKEFQVYEYLKRSKLTHAHALDDIPAKTIQYFACDLANLLTDVINTMVRPGQYPNIWEIEIMLPVPSCLAQYRT